MHNTMDSIDTIDNIERDLFLYIIVIRQINVKLT